MIDLFNLSGTFLRKITRYSVRPEGAEDGTFLEEEAVTSLNSEGVYETTTSIGLSVLSCGHVIHHFSEIGCQCPLCGSLNCLNHCTHVCERCLLTIGNCCTKIFEGRLLCARCYRVVRASQGALLTGRATGKLLMVTGKVLLIPFRGKGDG